MLEALVLSSLLTMPGVASAAYQGTVTVDGAAVAEPVAHLSEIGKAGSTVEISSDLVPGLPVSVYSNAPEYVGIVSESLSVDGASITTGSVYLQNNDTVSIGTGSTDTVTIGGGTERAGISAYNLTGDKSKGPQVTVAGKDITISTDNADGDWGIIELQNNTQETEAPSGGTQVTVKGDTVKLTSPELGLVNYSNGQLTIEGDTTLEAPTAISARGNSTTSINADGAHTTVIKGNIEFESPWTSKNGNNSGSIINANVNLNLTGADSSWTGRAYEKYTDEAAGETSEQEHLTGDKGHGDVSGLSLTMKDGAAWNVTGSTIMSTLDAESSTINFQEEAKKAVTGTNTLKDTTVNVAGSDAEISAKSLEAEGSTLNLEGANAQLQADKAALTGGTVNLDGAGSSLASDALTASGTTFNMNGENTALKGNATVDQGTIDVNSSAASADTLTLNDSTVNLNGDKTRFSVGTLAGSSATVNTDSLSKKMTVGSSTISSLTVHGTGDISDAIGTDSDNAQKLADVVSDQSDKSVATRITTDEGILAGAYDLAVEDGKVNMAKSTYTPNESNVSIASLATMNLMTWRQENNDLNKRLGELRDSDGQQGVWARMVRGEAKYGIRGMKNQYNYYQVGYDTKVGKNWTVGAAYSRTDGTTSFRRGTSDNDHDGAAVYGSWLGDDGSFVDLIAKYAHLDTDYHVSGGAGDGDYDNDAFAVSAEYGKRFHGNNGFWIEPQAELTYGRVDSADYTTKRGVKVHHDSMDSLVGRLGFSLGKDIRAGHVYARASYLYDFDGDTDVTMKYAGNSAHFKDDIGGGWWEVGIGANLNLSKATHMYIDVEKTYGGDVTTPWQWGVGFRYSF